MGSRPNRAASAPDTPPTMRSSRLRWIGPASFGACRSRRCRRCSVPPAAVHAAPPAAVIRLRDPDERWLHLIIVSRSLGDRP